MRIPTLAAAILFVLWGPSALAFSLPDRPVQSAIFEAMSELGQSVSGKDCAAHLQVDQPRGVQEISIAWTGACLNGLADGDGELTLLYDEIPMFSSQFSEQSGSVMYRGVPLSTLQLGDFNVLQSACLDAGWSLGNTRGGLFAQYPAAAVPNYWTFAQDALIAEKAAGCGTSHYPLRVLMKGEDVLGVVRGNSYVEDSGSLQNYKISLYSHSTIWNAAIDNYNIEIVKKRDALKKAQSDEYKRGLAEKYKDRSVPIDNVADFIMALGDVGAITELSKGRKVSISRPDIAFQSGSIVATFNASPTSSERAVNDLQDNLTWDKWFDVTVGGNNPMMSSIRISCIFSPDELEGLNIDEPFVAEVVLEQLQAGSVVFRCKKA